MPRNWANVRRAPKPRPRRENEEAPPHFHRVVWDHGREAYLCIDCLEVLPHTKGFFEAAQKAIEKQTDPGTITLPK